MLLIKEPNAEPIAGYRLLEPLGKGGFGEVWKCEAPGGLFKAIKFVESDGLGLQHGPADDELQAIQRIKGLRHPFLLSIERVEIIDGELVIVTELADKSLLDLLNERCAAGLPGIPRAELLRYLREAADVLDLLNLQHGLQHLDIKPANLFLVSHHVKVADFGLVHSLTDIAGGNSKISLGAITPRYAAPELFRSCISPTSDQYSLAIVYQELLTGTLPFAGKNSRQLAMQHTNDPPNLAPLPQGDRDLIARALAKDPTERFPNCTALVQALELVGKPRSGKMPAILLSPARSTADTQADNGGPKTAPLCPVGSKFLPDYQFVKQLGRTPTAETWSAQTKDGQKKLVQLLYGISSHDKRRAQELIDRLQALRHTGLPARQVLAGGPGCLIVVTDLLADSLRDRFQERRSQGEKGLSRRDLLDWLGTAAATLDGLAKDYQLQHLGLNPRKLLLQDGRLLIGDFGLLALLRQPTGQFDAPSQGRYAAPELLKGQIGSHCDQYSLAVIYQEMLTGAHPLRGGRLSPPNLDALAGKERDAVARALDPNPDKRFASCTDLMRALEEAKPGLRTSRTEARIEIAPAQFQPPATSANEVLAKLLARVAEELLPPEPPSWLTGPNGEAILEGRFHASLPPQGAEAKFEGFRRQWNAQLKHTAENSLTYYIGVPARFWQGWFGRPPGLLVEIQWTHARPPLQPMPQMTVRIRANDSGRHGGSLLKQLGPALLEGIQAQLTGASERRHDDRLLWAHPVLASFVMPDGQRSENIECQGKDISLTGMGLYLPRVLPGARLDLSLKMAAQEPPVLLAGNFVRVQRCGDGWFEAGVLFE